MFWRYTGGCLWPSGLACVAAVLIFAQQSKSQPRTETSTEPAAPRAAVQMNAERSRWTSRGEVDCKRPHTRDEERLCLEREAVKAAQKQADEAAVANKWALTQTRLNFLQAGGLMLSLGLAGWAAWAASRAANYAREAVQEGRRSADAANGQLEAVRIAERAYFVLVADTTIAADGGLQIRGSNFGRTHAHVVELRFVKRAKPPRGARPVDARLQKVELDVGVPTIQDVTLLTIPDVGEQFNCVFGYVRYFDVYQREHRSCFRYDRQSGGVWIACGGNAWNETT
jgi:hypothetical protein